MSSSQLYNRLQKTSFINYETEEQAKNKILVPSNADDRDHDNIDDYIYFNFEVNNNATEEKAIELNFDVNRLDPILKNPSAYEYGIERFSSPATIPIFIEDPNKLQLAVEIYDPNTELSFLQPVEFYRSIYTINGFETQYKNYINDGVYDYQTLTNAINTALDLAVRDFDQNPINLALGKEFPEGDDGEDASPFIRYFQSSGNFTLYAPEQDGLPTPPDPYITFNQGKFFPLDNDQSYPEKPYLPLQIRFSRTLAKLFSGFQQFNFNDDDNTSFPNSRLPVMMVIQDTIYTGGSSSIGNTNVNRIRGVNFRYSTTQWDVRPEMNQFDKILFLSNQVPIKDELLGEVKAVQERQLFDYVISNRLQNREQINFFPQYIKWSNLQSQQELRKFTMSVYLQYRYIEEKQEPPPPNQNPPLERKRFKQPILYPLTLQPNERFSAKIVFRKRKMVNVRNIEE
jgi:hypothetical protein